MLCNLIRPKWPDYVAQNATGPDLFSLSFAMPQYYYRPHSRERNSLPSHSDRYRDGVRLSPKGPVVAFLARNRWPLWLMRSPDAQPFRREAIWQRVETRPPTPPLPLPPSVGAASRTRRPHILVITGRRRVSNAPAGLCYVIRERRAARQGHANRSSIACRYGCAASRRSRVAAPGAGSCPGGH